MIVKYGQLILSAHHVLQSRRDMRPDYHTPSRQLQDLECDVDLNQKPTPGARLCLQGANEGSPEHHGAQVAWGAVHAGVLT